MQLFSRQAGSPQKPTIVLLHGFLGQSTDWSGVVKYLQADFYCVLIDLPAHGKSTHIESDINDGFKQCHQLIDKCLNSLNIDKFHLAGYSLGGRIALDYARTQVSSRILSLILESSHTGLTDKGNKKLRLINDQKWADKFKVKPIEKTLVQWYQQAVFENLNDVQKKVFIDEKLHNSGLNMANALLATSLSKQENALTFLKHTSIPVLYLYGEHDIKFKMLSDQFKSFKNIKVHSFSSVGHNIHHENPLQYTQFIHNFITTESK